MPISQAEFNLAKGHFFDLDVARTDARGGITVIAATIQGVIGSKNSYRRETRMSYRLLSDVSDLVTELPEGWIVSPHESQIEHVNIWPANRDCPFTMSRMPRICWGSSPAEWMAAPAHNRTLGNFLEVARQVLGHANLRSPAR